MSTLPNRGLNPARGGFVADIIRGAFRRVEPPRPPHYVHRGRVQSSVPAWGCGARSSVPRLVVIIPSLADRCGVDELWQVLTHVQATMARAAESGALDCGLILAMQSRAADAPAIIDPRLSELESRWTNSCGFAFLGVRCDRPSKLLALTACRAAAAAFSADMVAWFDDDVLIDRDCLRAMVARFDPAHAGIYGGRKVAIPDRSRFSARWAEYKNRIEPVNVYPHGCAVLMSNQEFQLGIPPDYQSDDNYFLLQYVDVDRPDQPLARLVVVPDAVILVPSTNDIPTACRRIARNYRNGLRILADASPATARYFLFGVLFSSIRAPRQLSELATRAYWSGLLWHTLKMLFWASVAGEVIVRGVLRKPRGVEWYSAPFPATEAGDDGSLRVT